MQIDFKQCLSIEEVFGDKVYEEPLWKNLGASKFDGIDTCKIE